MVELPDGTYAVLIVDVEEIDAEHTRIEVVVTVGAHKGDVIAIRAPRLRDDALDLLGLPATLVVDDRAPRLTVDD